MKRTTLDQPTLLTQGQICRRLGISDETWRRWRAQGRAPRQVDGFPRKRPRWRLADIEAFERGDRLPVTGKRTYFGTAVRRRTAA